MCVIVINPLGKIQLVALLSVGYVCVVCRTLAFGRLCSMIVALSVHHLYYFPTLGG